MSAPRRTFRARSRSTSYDVLVPHYDVPALVRSRAQAMGPAGVAWLEQLDATVGRIAADWELQVGRVLDGGSGALVAEVVMADGVPAILKVAVPDPDISTIEADILRAADGRGYARLYHHNREQRAMVVERLGTEMALQGLPQDRQLPLYCTAIQEAWKVAFSPDGLIDGAEKARWLADFIPRTWEALGRPCTERTVAVALDFAARRKAAFDPARAVICHGDAHPGNLLAPLREGGSYKFIDPEPGFIEPEYDLGCWLRGWRPAQRNEPDPGRLAREAAVQLAELTGTNTEAIWEWGFVERVSSGLLLMHLGHEEGELYLAIADAIAGA
jgi:streptomycin 6-kinase